MKQENALDRIIASLNLNAVRTTAVVFGVYAGILGMEHGYFEILQGNVAPAGLKIMASNPSELPFPFGHEPAMTVIPNFLVTGILAMVVGLSIILWSIVFLQSKHGSTILLLLSILLLLVGGGFGPITLLITAIVGATKINKTLTWWRANLPSVVRRVLAILWPWSLAAALLWVPAEFVMGQILHLKNDHVQALTNLNLVLSYPMLGLFALTLITGFAHKIYNQLLVGENEWL